MSDDSIKIGVANKEGQLGFVFTRGGMREGAGRKGIGVTRKVSLTLSDELWEKLEQHCHDRGISRSEAIRHMIETYYSS
jgi:hypothetical protein